LAAAAAGKSTAALRVQELKALQERNQFVADSFGQQFDLLARIAEGFGGEGSDVGPAIDLASSRLAVLTFAGASLEDRADAAFSVVDAVRAGLDQAISDADSAAEKLAIATEGLQTPEQAQITIIEASVQAFVQNHRDILDDLAALAGYQVETTREMFESLDLSGASNPFERILVAARQLQGQVAATGTGLSDELVQEMVAAAAATGQAETATYRALIKSLNFRLGRMETIIRLTGMGQKQGQALKDQLVALRQLNRQIEESAAATNVVQGDTPGLARDVAASAEDEAEKARQAMIELQEARFALLEAQVANDPVALARVGQQRAAFAYQIARTEAEQIRAEAERINADRQLQDALNDIVNSQIELAMAYANAAGDTVQVANLQLQQAITQLQQLQAAGAGAAEINRAQAEIVNARAGVRDANLQDRQEFYQYLHDMGQITTSQLVGYLQSLLQIPDLTEDQVRDINLQIKRLRQELASDLQFNLPTDLGLPTLYEVRRLSQSSAAGLNYQAGQGVTNNNQVITVNVNGGDPQQVFDAVSAAVNAPPRSGNYASLY
jgi:hypothetical protein